MQLISLYLLRSLFNLFFNKFGIKVKFLSTREWLFFLRYENGSSWFFFSCTQLIPIFNAEKFEWCNVVMKTLLRLQELWDLVEYEFINVLEPIIEGNGRVRETKKKDVKTFFTIQEAIHETIFLRMAAATTSKQTWSILQSFKKIQRL